MKRLVIIGGVAAGATAAARARRLDSEAHITVLEAGSDVSFANCGLPYYIGGDIEYRSSLILSSPEIFDDQYRVEVHTNTRATRIERQEKRVIAQDLTTGEEREYPYDSLILAQGGKPVMPPIPGADARHVFSLWTLDDMDRIDRFLNEAAPKRATVVGAGFIGLEMVESLVKRGLEVTIVEMLPQVMPNLDPEFAGFLTRELEEYGVRLHLGRSVTSIEEAAVELDNGETVPSDFVLLSVGVKPTTTLAAEAGLEIGPTGALAVDRELRTSDPAIYAAGDMAEIPHAVTGAPMRIPLAGPANRQGRIAAENALGGSTQYRGALGTSVVRVFEAVAGSTGMSVQMARSAGYDADSVVVHKVSHTSYYPGSERVSLLVVFDRESGKVLGAQASGRTGVDKRLDVIATAIFAGMTLSDLSELDLAYAPPFNSPNGPVNMAAFTAENHRIGFSPSIRASEIERFIDEHEPIIIDLRDPIAYRSAHLAGSMNMSHSRLRERIDRIHADATVLLISEDGQKGHVALRMLVGAGIHEAVNLSGGYISLERYARAVGFARLKVGLVPLEERRIAREAEQTTQETEDADRPEAGEPVDESGPLVIDVRTPMEYSSGAYPGAINIPLDDLPYRAEEFTNKHREIILYCASGARSAYGQRILSQMGFTSVENAGGLQDIMAMDE